MSADIANEAKAIAERVAVQLEEREKLHIERHTALQKSVDDLRSMMAWVGGLLITLILGVLGWSLLQQYNANEAQKQALQEQIKQLQEVGTEVGSDTNSRPTP